MNENQTLRLKCLKIAFKLGYQQPNLISEASRLYKYIIYGEQN